MILVVNAGSSSIKVEVFDTGLVPLIAGAVTEIGGDARLELGDRQGGVPVPDHETALDHLLTALGEDHDLGLDRITAVAHRVVHGGARLIAPVRITPQVLQQIADNVPLAPLHNPHNLAGINALTRLAPGLPQFASFDTAFHATNPAVAARYAIPDTAAAGGIRRYGFHGISYASLVRALPDLSGQALPGRILACHLGNGASLCAIRGGQSVATTMGYSPLEGLTMGTRSGGIDANAVLRMADTFGTKRTGQILNHESGLKGLSGGVSDMRLLMQDDGPESAFAVEHFCYWARRHAGSMIAAMEGVDAIAFTGGIGENAAGVRAAILQGLSWAGVSLDEAANAEKCARISADGSAVSCWIVPADEERMIAADALDLLNA